MTLTQIHQVEITSRCNLKCRYCVHPKMPRPKVDMDHATFEQTINLVSHYVRAGTQHELNLCGIGESTLHPHFEEFVAYARERLPDIDLTMATNGVNMTEGTAAMLADYRVRTWVSLHRPERAGLAIEMLKRHGILAGVSADPSVSAVNWAGQVDWHVSAAPVACMWLALGLGIAFSDGRVGTCSFDGQGKNGIIGTVWSDPATLISAPYSLCETCHMTH